MIEIGEIIQTTENEMENIMIECDMEEDEVHLSALDEVHLSALDEVVGEVVGGENEPENSVLALKNLLC